MYKWEVDKTPDDNRKQWEDIKQWELSSLASEGYSSMHPFEAACQVIKSRPFAGELFDQYLVALQTMFPPNNDMRQLLLARVESLKIDLKKKKTHKALDTKAEYFRRFLEFGCTLTNGASPEHRCALARPVYQHLMGEALDTYQSDKDKPKALAVVQLLMCSWNTLLTIDVRCIATLLHHATPFLSH